MPSTTYLTYFCIKLNFPLPSLLTLMITTTERDRMGGSVDCERYGELVVYLNYRSQCESCKLHWRRICVSL